MDNLIYSLAYWLRGFTKSTTIIKVSLYALLTSIPLGIFVHEYIFFTTLVVVKCVQLVLEFLYAKNQEIQDGVD